MKKSVKRALSLTLCIAMMAAMFAMPAYAVEEDDHDCLDCLEHGTVFESALPVDGQMIFDGGGAVTMAVSACITHSYNSWQKTGSGVIRNVYCGIVYLPGGNPVPCYMTVSYDEYARTCKNCSAVQFGDPVITGRSHSISYTH